MPPSNSTSSTPGREPGVAPPDGDPAARAEHDDGAGAAKPDGDDDSGDARAGVGDDGADSDGADDEDAFADARDEAGRVASRPGYPAEPAARSRPFGRVSLAPPLPPVAARSACPAARSLTAAAGPTPWRQGSTASSTDPPWSPRAGAARRAHQGLRLARPRRLRRPRDSPRLRPGRHPVPRRCRLRLAPAPALRRAPVPAPVRAPPPPPPAAPPAAHTPQRLPSASFAGVDSPPAHAASRCLPRRRGRLCSHTRRIDDAPLPPVRTGAMGDRQG